MNITMKNITMFAVLTLSPLAMAEVPNVFKCAIQYSIQYGDFDLALRACKSNSKRQLECARAYSIHYGDFAAALNGCKANTRAQMRCARELSIHYGDFEIALGACKAHGV